MTDTGGRRLDELGWINHVDTHSTREALRAFPAQCREAARRDAPVVDGGLPRLIALVGMGGSAASADLIAAGVADRLEVPMVVHRGYGLPAAVNRDALVVASSYSGETAEVLSAVDVALARGARIVAVTAGGTLARVAAAHGLPCVTMPAGLQPRLALGHLFFGLVTALRAACIPVATDREIDEALRILADCAVELVPESPAVDNEAKQLAAAIDSRIAVIYGGPVTGAVAYRWKTDLEENAKAFAVAGTLPEMNHNELEAWQSPAARDLHLVCLRHAGEAPPIARRFALLRELIGARAAGVSEVHGRGTTPLAVLLSLAYVGQWVSFYVAMLRGVDPWPVRLLDELKRRLAREPDPATQRGFSSIR